jgi:hypothetical protein
LIAKQPSPPYPAALSGGRIIGELAPVIRCFLHVELGEYQETNGISPGGRLERIGARTAFAMAVVFVLILVLNRSFETATEVLKSSIGVSSHPDSLQRHKDGPGAIWLAASLRPPRALP